MNDPRVPHDHDYGRTPEDTTARLSDAVPDAAPETGPLVGPRVGPEAGPAFGPETGEGGYSATALGSHWFDRPERRHPSGNRARAAGDTAHAPGGGRAAVVPDRVEGEVLRFGPGVTALAGGGRTPRHTTAEIWHGTLAGHPDASPRPPRRRGLRRYTLAAVVLVCVTAFLLWQRYGPGIAVEKVAVSTTSGALGCDSTADIVGVVDTNGRAGTLVYRWLRSDGTTSGRLREELTHGQKQARLHLLWTFRGSGRSEASAELEIVSPSSHRAFTRFAYRCA
ncbi:hypothetical protein [Streptomyces sp. NPDC004726]